MFENSVENKNVVKEESTIPLKSIGMEEVEYLQRSSVRSGKVQLDHLFHLSFENVVKGKLPSC